VQKRMVSVARFRAPAPQQRPSATLAWMTLTTSHLELLRTEEVAMSVPSGQMRS
jgi:hypothetical protein